MESLVEVLEVDTPIEYYANENYLVGGFSIVDLIIAAFDKEYLKELPTLVDYINALTDCQKLDSSFS